MRRLLAAVAVSALIFGVAFAGAKVVTVTNPMSADLNANGFRTQGETWALVSAPCGWVKVAP